MKPPRGRRVRIHCGLRKGVDVPVQIKVVESQTTDASIPAVENALRTLARLMVRRHGAVGEGVANADDSRTRSTLTVVPHRSPHDHDEAA